MTCASYGYPADAVVAKKNNKMKIHWDFMFILQVLSPMEKWLRKCYIVQMHKRVTTSITILLRIGHTLRNLPAWWHTGITKKGSKNAFGKITCRWNATDVCSRNSFSTSEFKHSSNDAPWSLWWSKKHTRSGWNHQLTIYKCFGQKNTYLQKIVIKNYHWKV